MPEPGSGPAEAVKEYPSGYAGSHHREQREFVIRNLNAGADGYWAWRCDARGLKGER